MLREEPARARQAAARPSVPKVQQLQVPPGLARHREAPGRKAEHRAQPRVRSTAHWTCGECLQAFPDRDAYVLHMKAHHGRVIKHFVLNLFIFVSVLILLRI